MSQFYAQAADEQKCLRSSLDGTTITINGKTIERSDLRLHRNSSAAGKGSHRVPWLSAPNNDAKFELGQSFWQIRTKGSELGQHLPLA